MRLIRFFQFSLVFVFLLSIGALEAQNKKYITYLRGLEKYDIDARSFAKDVALRFASSVKVETADSISSTRPALRAASQVAGGKWPPKVAQPHLAKRAASSP